MYKGEPAAIVHVRLAGKASQSLFDHLEQEHTSIAKQSPALRGLRCERRIDFGRLVVPMGKPANKTDSALWQEFRSQLAQAICNLSAAMEPLFD